MWKVSENIFRLQNAKSNRGCICVSHRKKACVDGYQTKYALHVITYNNKTPQKVKLRARQKYYRMID